MKGMSGKFVLVGIIFVLLAVLVLAVGINIPELNAPTNNSWTTKTNDTITFGFNYTGDNATASCELFINGTGFGVNSSVVNNTNTTMNANNTIGEGVHNWSITCTNSPDVNSSVNFTLNVDRTNPAITYSSVGNSVANANLSQSYIFVNVTANDTNGANITFVLYNSTEVNTTIYNSITTTINWTGLADGNYTYNVTINDSASNSNSTTTRAITLDTTSPVVTLIAPANAVSSTTSAYNFTFNVTDINSVANCSLIIDDSISATSTSINNTGGTVGIYNSSLAVAAYTWNINCTDIAGNVANGSVRTLTVSAAAAAATTTTTSSGGGGYPTYRPSADKLSAGYKISLGRNFMVRFGVADEDHSLKVNNISSNSATITISSEPIVLDIIVGKTEKVDVNADGVYDLSVYLKNIAYQKANFVITSISGAVPVEDVVGDAVIDVTDIPEDSARNYWAWVIWMALIIVVIIVALKFRKR